MAAFDVYPREKGSALFSLVPFNLLKNCTDQFSRTPYIQNISTFTIAPSRKSDGYMALIFLIPSFHSDKLEVRYFCLGASKLMQQKGTTGVAISKIPSCSSHKLHITRTEYEICNQKSSLSAKICLCAKSFGVDFTLQLSVKQTNKQKNTFYLSTSFF